MAKTPFERMARMVAGSTLMHEALKTTLRVMSDPNADEYFEGTQLETYLENVLAYVEGKSDERPKVPANLVPRADS